MDRNLPNKYWTTRIRPKNGWFDINLKELWQYRDLILLLIKRDFSLIYKQTFLGPLWVLLQPIMTTIVFTVVFGNIAGLPTDGVPKFMFYMGGNIAWQYFADCLTHTANTFIDKDNVRVFSKVYFPRLCTPISIVFSRLINFFVTYIAFVVFVIIYAVGPNPQIHPNWRLIALSPLMIFQIAVLALGMGILISSMTTKYRDLALLVGFGVHLWMYATPVTYSATLVADKFPGLLGVYMLNPMTPVIEVFRSAYLGTPAVYAQYYWMSVVVTIVVFLLGVVVFSRVEKTFMDTV